MLAKRLPQVRLYLPLVWLGLSLSHKQEEDQETAKGKKTTDYVNEVRKLA